MVFKKEYLFIIVEVVGMWESRRDFRGRWKGWKTCSWFSRLSTGRHFHRLHGPSPLVAEGAFDWCLNHFQPGPKSKIEAVKLTDFDIAVEDSVDAFFHLLKSYLLAPENLADEDTGVLPTHIAAVVHFARQEAAWVLVLGKTAWKDPRTRQIETSWCLIL